MKKYINTSNYYLSTITSGINSTDSTWHFDVSDVTVDWVTVPEVGYYWVDVDFGDASKREIFRIKERKWYTLYYDQRISPNGKWAHTSWASVWLRDFSQLLNSLSTNTDNFWEIEQTWLLTILVRGWDIYTPSNMNAETGKIHLDDEAFTLDINSTSYVIIEHDTIAHPDTQWYWFNVISASLLEEEWQYPIAKIITGNTMIDENGITDLRATIINPGNMRSEVYDPDWKKLDVYNYENFYNTPVATDWDISDIADRNNKRNYWNDKQEELVSWQNIVTVNHKSIIDVSQWENWNISLDTVLTVWWDIIPTEDWASTFTFPELRYPINDDAFIVFSDSGTMLIKNWDSPNDYSYDASTHTITFNNPLYDEEHAIIWVMYNNWDWETQIWDWDIYIKYWNQTIWTFHVNQNNTTTIDISPYIHNIHSVTQEEYNELLPDAETNWEWYLIVS